MNGTPPKPPQSADKWRKKRDEARQKKQDLDSDVATATTVPLKNVFATLAPSTAERIKRMQDKAAPSSPPPPPPRRSIDPAACARREARVASLVRSSRDASPVSSVASTPVKVPVESEALTTTSPTTDVVSAAAASLRRAPARFATDDSPDAKTVNSAAAALAALSVHDKAVAAGVVAHAAAVEAEKRDSTESWDQSPPQQLRVWRGGGVGGTGGGYRPPKRGRRYDFSMLSDFSGVGGGFSGQIGGGGRRTQKIGAVGHQRHIDHVFVAKGDGVRDDGRMDKQCRARCVRAFVRTDTSSENFRLPGESRCACGAFNAARYLLPAVRRCTCDDVDGVWASDHFPVVADLRLSWAVGEGEPSSRELDSNGRRPNTP